MTRIVDASLGPLQFHCTISLWNVHVGLHERMQALVLHRKSARIKWGRFSNLAYWSALGKPGFVAVALMNQQGINCLQIGDIQLAGGGLQMQAR